MDQYGNPTTYTTDARVDLARGAIGSPGWGETASPSRSTNTPLDLAGSSFRYPHVLTAYAKAISHRRAHDDDIAGMLHRGEHVAAAHQHLRQFIRELIADAAAAGAVRQDVPADELTVYCLHALAAAPMLHRPAAIRRLIQITLTGLRTSDPE